MNAKSDRPKRARKPKHVWLDQNNEPVSVAHWSRFQTAQMLALLPEAFDEAQNQTSHTVDENNPLCGQRLVPGKDSKICDACRLHAQGAENPYIEPLGAENPRLTIVLEGVSSAEDKAGKLAVWGYTKLIKEFIDATTDQTGVSSDQVRFVPITRCAPRTKGKAVDLRGKGEYCKNFLVQDLKEHRPELIFAVGTVPLGLLSHKSNAQDWSGKLLTYRGWPDDWLVRPDYMLPTTDDKGVRQVAGHPFFGPPPTEEDYIPLYALQHPRLIYAAQTDVIKERWKRQLLRGLLLLKEGVKPKQYVLPHFRFLLTEQQVREELEFLLAYPDIAITYDTETTGLYPWHGQKIVFMMFRYTHPETGEPVAVGFPWEYAESKLLHAVKALAPLVLEVLGRSKVCGHNLTFDMLFTYATLNDPDDLKNATLNDKEVNPRWRKVQDCLNALAESSYWDTWHMAYCFQQQRGSLGLDMLAYDWVPEMAGYEEAMTLLIQLHADLLHPENGGHYARCPEDKWETHLKPYVLGDVEVAHLAKEAIAARMEQAKVYKIPLAHATKRGFLRYFQPPRRDVIYEKIMSPAARILAKMMGRGMYIDQHALKSLEVSLPAEIRELRKKMAKVTPEIEAWCQMQEAVDPNRTHPDPTKHWELDLENKEQLREILFRQLNLPVQRLTKAGRKLYGDEAEEWPDKIRSVLRSKKPDITDSLLEFEAAEELLNVAAMDKFTLNKLSVDHPEVRPLQEYRKSSKLYGTYVRPLRNVMAIGVDKKAREQMPHLCHDGTIHAQFLLTGTRGGRLSSRNPNLQNLPKKGDVKKLYSSRFGKIGCIYAGDMSQVELRLLASACGDASMVDAYERNLDLHSLTASRIFKVSYDDFSKDHFRWLEEKGKTKEAKELRLKRDIAKTTNFLTGYGGGAFGLQNVLANNQVYIPIEECESIIAAFFASYPALKELLSYYKRFIEDHQVAVSIFGRVRVFEEVLSEDGEARSKALRAGCNHLIQSTASDMMLISLVVIEHLMREAGLQSMLVSTVHDSLVIDAVRSELPQIHEIVTYVLNNLPEVFTSYFGDGYDTSWMITPFAGDCDVGLNYYDMKGVPTDTNSIDWDKLLSDKA